MKTKISNQSSKLTLLSGAAALPLLLASSSAFADPVPVEDFSFEEPAGNNSLVHYDPSDPNEPDEWGWTAIYEFEGMADTTNQFMIGSFAPSLSPNPIYADYDAPDGVRILFLFTWENRDGEGYYGVEKNIFTISADTSYSISIDVGNIASAPGDQFDFSDFPDYRVQLYIGDSELPIVEDVSGLDLGEGEYGTSKFTLKFHENSPYIGEPIRMRLVNMNNPMDDGVFSEVNFDNVRVESGPYTGPSTDFEGPQNFAPVGGVDDSAIDLGFTVSGKGTKRVLLTGRGQSLETTIKNLAKNPFLTVRKNGRNIDRSDDWMLEDQATEIQKWLKLLKVDSALTDAAVILELGAGDYTALLSAAGEKEGYACVKIYDLNPDSKATLSFPTNAERDLRQIWNLKSARRK